MTFHPNVIDFIEAFDDTDNVYIVLSMCSQRSLYDLQMCQQNGRFTEIQCRDYIRQVMNGLKFLQHNRIIHRDLKPDNVLVDSHFRARICDFGLSMWYDHSQANGNDEMCSSVCGTLSYMAPEIFLRKRVSYKSDVWAVAVMAYYMRLGCQPFYGFSERRTFERIVSIDY